jgi:hypothetical protein
MILKSKEGKSFTELKERLSSLKVNKVILKSLLSMCTALEIAKSVNFGRLSLLSNGTQSMGENSRTHQRRRSFRFQISKKRSHLNLSISRLVIERKRD